MNETKLDWDDLRLFLAVAREGGLAAASAHTNKSAPTLGRRILALENNLGLELFRRLPTGYVLTEQGEQLLNRVLSVEDGIRSIASTAQHRTIRRVKISAGTWVTQQLCSRLVELSGPIPVILQFISADHVLDIGHREAVIGVRNKRPEKTTLAGRRIGKVRFAVYAANESVHTWARVLGNTPSAEWLGNHIQKDNVIEVTHPGNALHLAVSGLARAVLPTFIGDSTVGLCKVSDDISELEHMQWLVSHHEDRHAPEVRQVIDLIFAILKQETDG